MTTVQEIEEAVQHLPKKKLAQFRSWFDEFDARQWDKQFAQDAKSGKLDTLADQALKDLQDKGCTEL